MAMPSDQWDSKKRRKTEQSKLAFLATAATIIPDDGEEEINFLSKLAILKRVALHHSFSPGQPLPPPPRLPTCTVNNRLGPLSTKLQEPEMMKTTVEEYLKRKRSSMDSI